MTAGPRRLPIVAILLAWAGLAMATVPGEVNYQGLLLDDQGAPINGNVDLDFELFDAITGGTSLWTESHGSVPVQDGVYEVALGSVVPLTPSVFSGGAVFLEVTVDSETLAPRQQLAAVPYSLLAENAENVGGLSSVFTTEIFEHFSFDGQEPPNDDPTEGLGDADGDGLANFVDADNDDDLILDAAEVAMGSDINVPTPQVLGVTPASTRTCAPVEVDIQGTSFEAGATVDLGSQSGLVPNSITPTSLLVDVGPQAAGVANVTVTNPTLEFGSATGLFSFVEITPDITGFSDDRADPTQVTNVTLLGTGFEPGLTVQFGSQSPTAMNVTSTSFDVDVGPQPAGPVTVTVTNTCGENDSEVGFEFLPNSVVFATSTNYPATFGGIAAADAACASAATAASLSGTFLAWISDGAIGPATRFDRDVSAYVRTDGVVVADDWDDLTDGSLDAPIQADEFGNSVGNAVVWTGVNTDGIGDIGFHCSQWTSTTGSGKAGTAGSTNGGWTNFFLYACDQVARLYCFQQ